MGDVIDLNSKKDKEQPEKHETFESFFDTLSDQHKINMIWQAVNRMEPENFSRDALYHMLKYLAGRTIV